MTQAQAHVLELGCARLPVRSSRLRTGIRRHTKALSCLPRPSAAHEGSRPRTSPRAARVESFRGRAQALDREVLCCRFAVQRVERQLQQRQREQQRRDEQQPRALRALGMGRA